MRRITKVGKERVEELEKCNEKELNGIEAKKLIAMRLVASHELKGEEIAQIVGRSRATIFNWLRVFLKEGLKGLLSDGREQNASKSRVDEETKEALAQQLRLGKFRRLQDIQEWMKHRGVPKVTRRVVEYCVKQLAGKLKVPRKVHIKKNEKDGEQFKEKLSQRLYEISQRHQGKKVRIWVSDEHRYGLLPVVKRAWSMRGVRATAPYATQYQWGYLYEAVEVDEEMSSEFFFSPTVNKEISTLFLQQICDRDPEAHHIIIWDGAGFHPKDAEQNLPKNVSLIQLPPYSPELNPVEKIGILIKNAVCNQVFDTLAQIQEKITNELKIFWQDTTRAAQLIGENYLTLQANASASY